MHESLGHELKSLQVLMSARKLLGFSNGNIKRS